MRPCLEFTVNKHHDEHNNTAPGCELFHSVSGFLISTLGWFLVCSTIAMDYWRISYIGNQGGSWVMKASWYWSTLWRDCFTDTTAVANCRIYDILWTVSPVSRTEQGYIQAVRGLVLFGMVQGFFAAMLCFVGMKCTYIGGSQKIKDKILLTGGILHFLGGLATASGYCIFTSRLGRATFARVADIGVISYEIGAPIYLGLTGSFCIIFGSILYVVTVYKATVNNRKMHNNAQRKSMASKTGIPLSMSRPLYAASTQFRPFGQSFSSNDQLSKLTYSVEMSGKDSYV